jgi:uncharacterized protein (DUF433 family)
MPQPIVAVDMARASSLSGIPQSTLRYWEKRGVFTPSHVHSERIPFRRVYSFRDLVSLRTLAEVRRRAKVSLEEIRRAGEYLSRFFESPWSELRFGGIGRRLYFKDPVTKEWIGTSSGQRVLELNLPDIPTEIANSLPSISERGESHYGKIARNRYVQHNQWVISGTRIPTSTIWSFHEAGYSTDAILREYPHLQRVDVDNAIRFEREQRAAA